MKYEVDKVYVDQYSEKLIYIYNYKESKDNGTIIQLNTDEY